MSANLFSKLSFHIQPRFLTPPIWLKSGVVVRCYSQKADGAGLPVRYVPKKHRHGNQTSKNTSVDVYTKSGLSSRGDSRRFGQKSLDGSNNRGGESCAEDKRNSSLNAECELTHKERTVRRLNNSKHRIGHQTRSDASDNFSAKNGSTSSISEHRRPEVSNDIGVSVVEDKLLNVSSDAKDEFIHEERYYRGLIKEHLKDSQQMEVPKQVVKELSISEGSGRSQSSKTDQKIINHDGPVDAEYLEAPDDDDVEDTEIYHGIGKNKPGKTKQDAQKLAFELLAKRGYTAVELQKKLNAKHFPVNVVETVVRDLQKRGLINDGLYAETFSHSRWKSSSWGPRRIKQALMKKGVSEVNVEKAVKLTFEDSEDGDLRSSIKLSGSSLQQLYVQASKQWQRSHNVPPETRKARVIRWLQYRGFDWGVVATIIKRLESERPP